MYQIDIDTWEEFQKELEKLSTEYGSRKNAKSRWVSPFLFRGQADHRWKLTTTLERYKKLDFNLGEYYRIISASKPEIEAFTGLTWEIPGPHDLYQKISATTLAVGSLPAYEYMVYLRHHGFPSPLLDWTRSAYIAAYFAFRNEIENSARVAIYAFWERPTGGKADFLGKPHIIGLGSHTRGHKRHFLQQSEYTICVFQRNEHWHYSSHEEVFARSNERQDLLWKITLPTTERLKVLKILDSYNLNASSLFGSEQELLETLALRQFHFTD